MQPHTNTTYCAAVIYCFCEATRRSLQKSDFYSEEGNKVLRMLHYSWISLELPNQGKPSNF
jgi:hypothetical protein